jgi:hypothetical protein
MVFFFWDRNVLSLRLNTALIFIYTLLRAHLGTLSMVVSLCFSFHLEIERKFCLVLSCNTICCFLLLIGSLFQVVIGCFNICIKVWAQSFIQVTTSLSARYADRWMTTVTTTLSSRTQEIKPCNVWWRPCIREIINFTAIGITFRETHVSALPQRMSKYVVG